MKNYNFDLAKKIINTFNDLGVLSEASMGMQEDWFWTGNTVFEDGKYVIDLNDDTVIGGINGSSWATPVIQLTLNNGDVEVFECFSGDWTNQIEDRILKASTWVSGVLSEPCQINRMNIDVKKFEEQ